MSPSSVARAGAPAADAPPALPAGEERFLRAFPAKPFAVERAKNATLWTADGRTLIDLGGASQGVAVLGHNHAAVVAAVQEQATCLLHVAQTVPSPVRGAFLERLHGLLPPGLTRTFLGNSGTEANECAIKLAVAATGRGRLVAAAGSFHGRSTSALSVTHRAAFRRPFAPILPEADFVPFGDEEALKAAVTGDTAALMLEPVQGEGGVRPASPSYLRAARDVCDDTGAMLVFDEVQSGMGRTGTFLASGAANVVPDAVTMGKGLAGGLPVGACSVTADLADRLPPGGHGSTYGGAPLACAAGEAALWVLVEERLMERAATLGLRLQEALRGLEHPLVREVRGAGLMVGMELRVRPGPVLQSLAQQGFLALSAGTTEVRFLPPLTIDERDLQAAVEAVGAALGAAHG